MLDEFSEWEFLADAACSGTLLYKSKNEDRKWIQKQNELYLRYEIEKNHKDTDVIIYVSGDLANDSFLIDYGIYVPHKIVESKKEYIFDGFITDKSENVEVLPITFFNDGEIPFKASIEDFDITPRALFHIIEERRHRFPENVRELSDAQLASKIKNALEIGLKMQLRDPSYAKPSYSTLTGTLSWMIPLHINSELAEEPELVLVLRKAGEFYEIKTILPYDDETKDKLTDLSLYSRLW